MTSPQVLFVMGPTATGKTALAMELADRRSCSLISVDSALVYRGMDIGTAKPEPSELARYPHHLIDICEPDQPYSASRFRDDAMQLIEQAIKAGKLPVLVGGTMLYFKTLMQGIADLPSASESVRSEINEQAGKKGWSALHQELTTIDPEAARRIKPGDSQRIQRALEVHRLTGKTLSQFFAEQKQSALNYPVLSVALRLEDRTLLRQRIRQRFEHMLDRGLIKEVKFLLEQGDFDPELPAMRSVGYRQVVDYLAGEYDYETMIDKAVTATSRLAKRQMTWLRSWPDLNWLEAGAADNIYRLEGLLNNP